MATVKMEGLRELDAALAQLPKSTARSVLRRALKKAAQPVADAADRMVPVKSGGLKASLSVAGRTRNLTGLKEYGQTLKAGGSREEAVGALRSARRAAGGGGSRAEIDVRYTAPHAHLLEFGTVKMPAHPYLRPAWDGNKQAALESVKTELASEIEKAVARAGKKAARLAAKG